MGTTITNINILEKIIDYTPENGLVRCDENLKDKHISEVLHINEVAKKIGATAVLFQRFFDKEDKHINSKPSVYIFEDEELFTNTQKATELHAKIWSAGNVEVYMIVGKTQLDLINVINARRPAEVKNNVLDIKNLKLWSGTLEKFNDQRFSAHIFGKGMFWEQGDFYDKTKDKKFFNNKLEEENTPFHQLLDYLLETRKFLHDKSILKPQTIDKLIIICLLIKFLEGKDDDNKKHTLRDIYKDLQIEYLEDSLSEGNSKFFTVLTRLSEEFNGQIFTILDNEKENIEKANLSLLAEFLRADLDIAKKQKFIWKQYNFNHLPVELISSVYENFLPKQKGVVYTPPFLVNFLIDEVMPLNLEIKSYIKYDKTQKCDIISYTILDPSCGSGVFLVTAYKRLLEWWIINQYNQTKEIIFPQKEVCQKILENNIFGVDIEPTATLITIFSLTITLLDRLSPKEIWNGLKFNNLQENIKTQNFFEWASDYVGEQKEKKQKDEKYDGSFDLVIGNPPFNDKSGKSNVKIPKELVEKIGFIHPKVAGNKLALLFFEGSMILGHKVCLIVKSSEILYNKDAQSYRNKIFKDFTIHKIFDFTHLRRELFGNADTPVCAIISENKPSEQKAIEHIIIHRLLSTEKKIAFQIDHYDRHWVHWDWAVDKDKSFIWKTNLLGGGRLFHLINRLSMLETFGDLINSKNHWQQVRGYEGGNNIKIKNVDRITEIKDNGEPIVDKGITITTNNLKDTFMYQPPFIIFDQIIGNKHVPISLIQKSNSYTQKPYLYYNRDFVGVSVPEQDEKEIEAIFQTFFSPKEGFLNFQTCLFSTSSSLLVSHETAIRQTEILTLPFPKNEEYLQLSETEKIIQNDVLDYYILLGKGIEEGKGKVLNEKVDKLQLENFGIEFCKVLNFIYEQKNEQGNILQKWQAGKVYQTPNFTIYEFTYGKVKAKEFDFKEIQDFTSVDENLKNLIFNKEENRSAIYTRVVREYDYIDGYDTLLLMKPNTLRYWLKSIALRDADDTIVDYYEAGF